MANTMIRVEFPLSKQWVILNERRESHSMEGPALYTYKSMVLTNSHKPGDSSVMELRYSINGKHCTQEQWENYVQWCRGC
jgi:hypothetical protein